MKTAPANPLRRVFVWGALATAATVFVVCSALAIVAIAYLGLPNPLTRVEIVRVSIDDAWVYREVPLDTCTYARGNAVASDAEDGAVRVCAFHYPGSVGGWSESDFGRSGAWISAQLEGVYANLGRRPPWDAEPRSIGCSVELRPGQIAIAYPRGELTTYHLREVGRFGIGVSRESRELRSFWSTGVHCEAVGERAAAPRPNR